MQSWSDWYVYQNIIRGNSNGYYFNPTHYQTGIDKPHDIYIENNTFHNNTNGIYWDSAEYGGNNHFKNNIVTMSSRAIQGEMVTPTDMVPSNIFRLCCYEMCCS